MSSIRSGKRGSPGARSARQAARATAVRTRSRHAVTAAGPSKYATRSNASIASQAASARSRRRGSIKPRSTVAVLARTLLTAGAVAAHPARKRSNSARLAACVGRRRAAKASSWASVKAMRTPPQSSLVASAASTRGLTSPLSICTRLGRALRPPGRRRASDTTIPTDCNRSPRSVSAGSGAASSEANSVRISASRSEGSAGRGSRCLAIDRAARICTD